MRVLGVPVLLAVLFSAAIPAPAREDESEPVSRGEWLFRHQSSDGSWSPADFEAQCEASGKCGGKGRAEDTVGSTGLVLVLFLGFYRETPDTPRFGPGIRRGFEYLRKAQDGEGCIGPRTSKRLVLNHARATFALAKVAAVPAGSGYVEAARKAVALLLALRVPDQGWPAARGGKETDLESSAWAVEALIAAREAGIDIGEGPMRGLLAWLDERTDPGTGRVGPKPQARRSVPADSSDPAEAPPESDTAMGTFIRILSGAEAKSDPIVGKGVALILAAPPARRGKGDRAYCYFGMRVCHAAGGDAWRSWTSFLTRAVMDSQVLNKEHCRFGSWDPRDTPDSDGRIVETALGVLCLQTYYLHYHCDCHANPGPVGPDEKK